MGKHIMTKNETSKTVMQGSYYYCTTTCQQVFFEDINELCLAVDNIWVIKNNFIQFLEPERQKQVIKENAEQIAFYRTREAYRFTKEYNDLLDAQIDSD